MRGRRDILRGGVGLVALQLTACGDARDPDAVEPPSARSGRSDDREPPPASASRPGAGSPREGGRAGDADTFPLDAGASPIDGGGPTRDAASDVARATVVLYDTNAQALYSDGTYGPFTGIVRVSYVVAGAPLTLDFWHGHGAETHRWTLTPAHFADLKRLRRVSIETTEVDGHTHVLFVDPVDPRFRVAGAQPVVVPV